MDKTSFIRFCGDDFKSQNIRFKSNPLTKICLKIMLHHLNTAEEIFIAMIHFLAIMLHAILMIL